MPAMTVKTFAAAHRIAMVHGGCKIQRLHKGLWVVIPSRLSRKLARRRAAL